MSTPDASEDRMQIGWLDPGKFAKIALNTERVVKIDQFYLVFQVTDSHLVAPGQPYLAHMTVDVHVTNTMPHSQVRASETRTPS
jgi:EAL domain-containing protein (putative c-di-GMP-specific phosphodiesterase class I)